jgi:hypothetical protein
MQAMNDGTTDLLTRDILFGLSLPELAALALGALALIWLLRRLGGSRRQQEQIWSQTSAIRCHGCGWTGTASRHTLRCPKCGNKALSV